MAEIDVLAQAAAAAAVPAAGDRTIGVRPGVGVVSFPVAADITASTSLLPTGIACSGTIAANGALTLGTALDRVYSGGVYLYFPASAFSAKPDGFYYVVMSSTTTGQVYESSGGPLVVGAGAAYTATLNYQPVASIMVPGGRMGARGSLQFTSYIFSNDNANSKRIKLSFGNQSPFPSGADYTTCTRYRGEIANLCDPVYQRAITFGDKTAGPATPSSDSLSVDTKVNQMLAINLQLTNPADWMILQNFYADLTSIA